MASDFRRSTLALAVLSLLLEAEQMRREPLHPYGMQRLIKDRGKGEVVNVGQRASLYRTIDRLHRNGLIRAVGSDRAENRPERTLYELTDLGRRVWREWMLDALEAPVRSYAEFPAALAFIPLLEPEEVLARLDQRRETLAAELDRIRAVTSEAAEYGRLFALEMEYLRATTAAELEWVESVSGDLRSGRITWSKEWLSAMASEHGDPTADDETVPEPGTAAEPG